MLMLCSGTLLVIGHILVALRPHPNHLEQPCCLGRRWKMKNFLLLAILRLGFTVRPLGPLPRHCWIPPNKKKIPALLKYLGMCRSSLPIPGRKTEQGTYQSGDAKDQI